MEGGVVMPVKYVKFKSSLIKQRFWAEVYIWGEKIGVAVVYKNNENSSSKKKRVLTLMFVVIMTKETS